MTQEEKDLLLRDLCARLPYGVKGSVSRSDHNNRKCEFVATIDGKLYDRFAVFQESWYDNVTIKPYLFPLSSMTEEQINELAKLDVSYGDYALHDSVMGLGISVDEAYIFFEFCYKHHIDFLGLIDLGLAIDATDQNIY